MMHGDATRDAHASSARRLNQSRLDQSICVVAMPSSERAPSMPGTGRGRRSGPQAPSMQSIDVRSEVLGPTILFMA